MTDQQDRGKAEDAIFLADMLLAQEKAKKAKHKAASGSKFQVQWVERDAEGRPSVKRSRSGETRTRASATVSVAPTKKSEEVPTVSQDNCSQHLFDTEMQRLRNILTSAEQPSEQPSTSSSWSLRQTAAQDEWRKARVHHINCLLSCNEVPEKMCSHCTSPAIIRCRDGMPDQWVCMECDIQIHTKFTLHNRDSFIEGIYKPIMPTVSCYKNDGSTKDKY